jgi:uridine kinase
VKLNDEESEYLLPHFLMLLVGKPGSGKTTLLKQLMTNPQMYYRKFDDVLLVSPSHAKMGVKVKNENTTANFDLDWIFEKLEKLNQDQLQNVFGHKLKLTAKDRKSDTGKLLGPTTVLGDQRSRWLLGDMFRPLPGQVK